MSDTPGNEGVPAHEGRGLLPLLAIPLGLGATWWWIARAPLFLNAITYRSDVQALVVFTLGLFVPLAVLGLVLGRLGGVRVATAGREPAVWLLAGLVLGAGGLAVSVTQSWLHGGVVEAPPAPLSASMIGLGVVLTLVQSGAEEVLIRGWLQGALVRETGAAGGILLASALFAALHLAGGPVAWHSLANMVLAGVLFGLLAWRSGGLVAPIAAHFAWNFMEDVGFGLLPNPGSGPFGALHDIEITGAVLWGGGPEGLNASAGTTIALLALSLPLVFLRSRGPGVASSA